MSDTDACPECLQRPRLLAELGPYIEHAVNGRGAPYARELLALSDDELAAEVAPDHGSELLISVARKSGPRIRSELVDANCWAVCRHSERFPRGLRGFDSAPKALIGRGDPAVLEELSADKVVTVVGSRRATSYGREVARTLGRDLGSGGVLVVSGLAFGIDACAHRGALDAGAPTVAVLGCGPDIAYPAAHRSLWGRIGERGAALSELPPGSVPWRWTFPARNRIMAALAGMTVVVEGAVHSGSLVTAGFAGELGRKLGAVPGPVASRASAGPNALLQRGALVVRGADDVFAALR